MPGVESKTIPHINPNQPEPTLGVGQILASQSRQPPAHPSVDPSPDNRHGVSRDHSIANNQRRASSFSGLEKPGNIRRGVLPIAVEGQNPGEFPFPGPVKAGRQSEPLPHRRRVSNHFGPSCARDVGSSIAGPIIHHQHAVDKLAHRGDHAADGSCFVEARKQRHAGLPPVHWSKVFNAMPWRERSGLPRRGEGRVVEVEAIEDLIVIIARRRLRVIRKFLRVGALEDQDR